MGGGEQISEEHKSSPPTVSGHIAGVQSCYYHFLMSPMHHLSALITNPTSTYVFQETEIFGI